MQAFLINNNIPFTELESTDDLDKLILNDLILNQRDEDYQINKKINNVLYYFVNL